MAQVMQLNVWHAFKKYGTWHAS